MQLTEQDPAAVVAAIEHPTRKRDARGADALLAKLGEHKVGVGGVYVNELADVDLGVLRQLIEVAWAHLRA